MAGRRLVQITTEGDQVLISDLGAPESTPLGDHDGCTTAHTAYLDAIPLAFTGGTDGSVRVWDLNTRTLVHAIHIRRPVWRITSENRMLLIAAGGEVLRFDHVSAG